MKKVENEETDNDESQVDNEDNDKSKKLYSITNFKELDADFEKDLCELWDMSVELDVCVVLDEFNSIQIFEGFIKKFDSIYPRAVEILLGILVNMASLSDLICIKLVSNKPFIQYLLFNVLSQMADVPSVIQCIRLFDIFLIDSSSSKDENENKQIVKQKLIDYLKNELAASTDDDESSVEFSLNWHAIIEKFYFILEQSLNPLLLDSTCSLLFNLFDCDEQILNAFAQDSRIVDALCSATTTRFRLDKSEKSFTNENFTTTRRENDNEPSNSNDNKTNTNTNQTPKVNFQVYNHQLSEDEISKIDHLLVKYFLCLQTLSTCESGVLSLIKRYEIIIELFDFYLETCLSTFNDWEIKSSHSLKASVGDESLKNLICLLSVLNCLFVDQQSNILQECHIKYPKYFLKLVTLCKYYLKLYNELKNINNNQEEENDDDVISSDQVESFVLATSNMKDLFENLSQLSLTESSDDDQSFKKLLNNTISLINNSK